MGSQEYWCHQASDNGGRCACHILGGEYRIGDGAWTSAPGTITNGQTVRVRQTSAVNYATTTTATLTIGGVSADFVLTTVAVATEILHTAWWSTNTGYTAYVMVQNTNNSTVTVNTTLLGRNGTSYTPSLTLAPQQARGIVINNYQANLPGAVNGAVELTHTGNPGDVVGDLIVFGPSGFSLSAPLR